MEQIVRSLDGLSAQYQSLVPPSVSFSVLSSPSSIIAPEARARALPAGVATRDVSQNPFLASFPSTIAGQYDPFRLAIEQLTTTSQMPASARTGNEPSKLNVKARATLLRELVSGLTEAEGKFLVPIPQPRDLAFVLNPKVMTDGVGKGERSIYTLTPTELKLATNLPPWKEHHLQLHRSSAGGGSTQEATLLNPAAVNYYFALRERKEWKQAKTAEEYEHHFFRHPAAGTFDSLMALMGVVDDHGNLPDGAHTAGERDTMNQGLKAMAIVNHGPVDVRDYLGGVGNKEGARVQLVIARMPIRRGHEYDLSFDQMSDYSGAGKHTIEFDHGADPMGRYRDTIYPIQIKILGSLTKDVPHQFISPLHGPWMHGAAMRTMGMLFFRSIGNIGTDAIHGPYHSTMPYQRPLPPSLDEVDGLNGMKDILRKRPIHIMMNGNPRDV